MSLVSTIPGIASTRPSRRTTRPVSVRLLWIGVLGTALASLMLVLSIGAFRSGTGQKELPTEIVRRAPLDVRITERGNVDSANNLALRCFVEWGAGTTILKIAEEGSRVERDQIVAELDSSRLRDEATAQVIKLRTAEAALKNADSDLEIQKMQNASDIAAAELAFELARLDLQKYEAGEYLQQLHVIEGEIRMAGEYLVRARERQAFTAKLMRRGFTTTKIMEAERVGVAKAEAELATAEEKLKVLEEYAHSRDLAELRSNARNFERELSRVKLRAEAALSQREATLLAKRRTCFLERQKHEKLARQIDACTIRSPRSGMVVYANRPESNREPLIYEGALVRELQPIVYLPDQRSMQVTTRVHESKVARLREGLSATILVDARSGETYHGVVEDVALVPDSGKWPNIHLKEYTTRVKITDDFDKTCTLKPGMTASVEILIEQMEEALQVPIQCCVERGGRYFAWVLEGDDEVERREIKLGLSSDTTSEVLSGLAEGDEVVLNPRRTLGAEIALLESQVPPAAISEFPGIPLPEDKPDEQLDRPETIPDVPPPTPGTPARESAIGPLAALPSREIERPRPEEKPADPMATFNFLDQNHDAKVSEAELPDPMKPILSQIDTNHDRSIDKEEWQQASRGLPPKPDLRRSGGGQ